MNLLHRVPAPTCPSCGHPSLGTVQQVLEPLVWSRRCCHVLVEDPWSYWGGDECGCESAQHHKRHELRNALKRWGHVAHLDRHARPKV